MHNELDQAAVMKRFQQQFLRAIGMPRIGDEHVQQDNGIHCLSPSAHLLNIPVHINALLPGPSKLSEWVLAICFPFFDAEAVFFSHEFHLDILSEPILPALCNRDSHLAFLGDSHGLTPRFLHSYQYVRIIQVASIVGSES